ncbi:MAG: helix-turn-helix domain-containing protein [Eubacteriales bacterium]|nr:helix-turn-helix domain-containing protein [Eubacteriales bacterium]
MERHPIRIILNLSHLMRRAMEQEMTDLELSSAQCRVLGYLWCRADKEKPVFQRELEAEMKIRRSSVTSVVQLLEKKGLLERRSARADARQKELVLTQTGIEVQRKVIGRMDDMEQRLNGCLTEEEKEWWFRCAAKLERGLKEAEYD